MRGDAGVAQDDHAGCAFGSKRSDALELTLPTEEIPTAPHRRG
jgi:hypothetical protein